MISSGVGARGFFLKLHNALLCYIGFAILEWQPSVFCGLWFSVAADADTENHNPQKTYLDTPQKWHCST